MASSPDGDGSDADGDVRPWWTEGYSVPALDEIRFPRLAVAGIAVAVLAVLAGLVLTILAVFVLETGDGGTVGSTVESSMRSVQSVHPRET